MTYPTLQKILAGLTTAMAFDRSTWIDKLAGRLAGAFGEWCKQRLSEEIGYKGHDWNNEVDTLLIYVREALTGKIKTKSNFNKKAAFKEAVLDAIASNGYIYAKRELKTHKLTKSQKLLLDKTVLNEKIEMEKMLEKFLAKEIRKLGNL